MDLSRFTNVPVMMMFKAGNLVSRVDTTISNFSIDADSVVIAHDYGEITAFHAMVQENPEFITIAENDRWSLSIFLQPHPKA